MVLSWVDVRSVACSVASFRLATAVDTALKSAWSRPELMASTVALSPLASAISRAMPMMSDTVVALVKSTAGALSWSSLRPCTMGVAGEYRICTSGENQRKELAIGDAIN